MVATLYAKLYWTLLASFCAMGLCVAFAQPLFSAPDETAHWQTAHYRLESLFGNDRCVLSLNGGRCSKTEPCSVLPKQELACVASDALYGGLLTYPGVLLSKLILPRQTESALRQSQAIMLARLLQGLVVVLALLRAGLLACRVQASGALLLGAFMSSPLVAQQAFAVSSDSVQLACGVCLFTAIVAFGALGWLDVALFFVLGWGAAAKPTLLVCVLPSMLVGFWYFQLEQDRSVGFRTILARLGEALKLTRRPSPQTAMLWAAALLSIVTVAFSLSYDATASAAEPPSPDRMSNAAALRERPLLALELITRMRYSPLRAETWVAPLGWLDTRLAGAVINAFVRVVLVMLVVELGVLVYRFVAARSAMGPARGRLLRLVPPLVIGLLGPAANVVFVTGVMYVLWSQAGSRTPEGVQFRYFFPAVMVLIGVVFRALSLALSDSGHATMTTTPEERRHQRGLWTAAVLAHGLVLSLSLPYIARVFVDLSSRYHAP